jgi:hypothetical protein
MPSRSSSKKEGRRYRIELTPVSAFLWSLGLLFLLSWIFVLGIMVGRGFIPDAVSLLSDLKGQINRLQEIAGRNRADEGPRREPNSEPKLDFYDQLSAEKEPVMKSRSPEQAPAVRPEGPPARDPAGRYTVQFASMGEREKAEAMIRRLTTGGHPVYYHEVKIKGKNYFRVLSKKIMSLEEAKDYAKKVEQEVNVRGIVTRVD